MTSRHVPPEQDGGSAAGLQRQTQQTQQDGRPHTHAHSHARFHHTHNRDHESPREVAVDKRSYPAVPYYTHVIQTLSLIYGTDAEGKPSIQTIAGPPSTVVVDAQTGETIAAISDEGVLITPPAPAPEPEPAANDVPRTEALPTYPAPLTTSTSAQITHGDQSSSSTISPGVISAPSPSASMASVAHHNNATNTPISPEPYIHSKTNSTMIKAFGFSTPSLTKTTSRSTIISSTTLSSFLSSSTIDSPTSTAFVGGGGGIPGGEDSQAKPAAGSDTNNGPLTPREKQIVGGVVGGVAGAAFFMLLVMLVLRWKKRRQAHMVLGDNDGPLASRAITGVPDAGGPAMSQRSSMPAAVAAAMASLTGKRKPAPEPAPEAERGFYRVSGRKLQSVLQTGGDGFTDPHDSMASGTSDYYRGSQAFDRGEGPSSHLTLGSPMRPASGVVVLRAGPGRTPVTEQNPFSEPPSPPPSRGPGTLGRSLHSQDGSGASGSRFREGI